MKRIGIALLLAIVFLTGCSVKDFLDYKITTVFDTADQKSLENSKYNNLPLREKKDIYAGDEDGQVKYLYITILNPQKDSEKYTFDMLNVFTGQKPPVFDIIMQEGQEKAVSIAGYYGFGLQTANASITLRGNANNIGLRSYKVKISENGEMWHLQKTLNLNKHLGDLSRSKNKFFFDCVEKIKGLAGFRTQFVNLSVKDLTKTIPDGEFVNYGIYTHIEQPNKSWLSAHGLDENGSVYKAVNCSFERRADSLKDTEDADYKKEEFEKVLSIEQTKDHTKLIAMLNDVNDESKDINTVFDKHFNRENFLKFTALNLLMGKTLNVNGDYILYSPKNALTWYFVPWDSDSILYSSLSPKKNSPPDSLFGISLYDDNLLYRRFFKDENNLKQLDYYMEDVQNDVVAVAPSLSQTYSKIMTNFLLKTPDIEHLSNPVDLTDDYIKSFKDIILNNYNKYKKNRTLPSPPFITEYSQSEKGISVKWLPSTTKEDKPIFYSVEFAKDEGITNVVLKMDKLSSTEVLTTALKSGKYFCRVNAYEGENNQICSNKYVSGFGKAFYGSFEINVK